MPIESLAAVESKIHEILTEARTLEALARDPSVAARQRLYARIATWIADHPDPQRRQDMCVVCSHPLDDALDPVTGRPVTAHLHDAQTDASLLSQTLQHWSENTLSHLIRSLPEPLQKEVSDELPMHPCDLLRSAIIDELFALEPFSGVLSELNKETATAFDETVAKRSDLCTLLLDDPQELLDDENRERLAASLVPLVNAGAQLIVTSYDPRFAGRVSRIAGVGGVEHFEVHPATLQQPVLRTTLPLPAIIERRKQFEADRNAEMPARDFADECRVFLESKLGDMFDDPAHSAWAKENPTPTLAAFVARLRSSVKGSPQGMFSAHVFRRFVAHKALADNSPVLELMNKAHHGRRHEIRAADVVQYADELTELIELVEQMHDEAYRWRRRDALQSEPSAAAPPALQRITKGSMPPILIYPDLAAFTEHSPAGESQDTAEPIDPDVFDNKAVFILRRNNFGFAAPAGALAIVEAIPGPTADRRLVIARHGSDIYARRLVRGAASEAIGLTAEVPDPRNRTPKTIFLAEKQVEIHQVVGIIFDHDITIGAGPEEAVSVDADRIFGSVEVGFRVVEDSAVPLALANQIVLGGRRLDLGALDQREGALVAITLDDGSSIFKRVGPALPGNLSHLRQFESIGGLGSSQVIAVEKEERGFRSIQSARQIIGVLYHG